MTSNLIEGQSFPPGFRLDRKLSSAPGYESWVATSEQTGDRVFARVLLTPPAEDDWQKLTTSVDAVKGLVHENISLTGTYGTDSGLHYLIEPYIAGGEPFSITDDDPWPVLKQFIESLQYIHGLGLAHGNIHPHNLVVDGSGTFQLTGMGVSAKWSSDTRHQAFLSPQAISGSTADQTDDIYSLGCLIYSVLTGRVWEPDRQADSPLPATIEPLLKRMTSESPFDRNVSPTDIRDVLARYFDDDGSRIATVDFAAPKTATPEPPLSTQVVTRHSLGISPRHAAIGFTSLMLLAILLFYLLPQSNPTGVSNTTPVAVNGQNQKQPTQNATTPAVIPETSPFAAAKLEFMQQEGEKVAREILRLQIGLEDRGVLLWGKDDFGAITTRIDAAEELYRERQYEVALDAYNAIRDDLEVLKDRIPEELAAQIERGDQALADADHQTALEAFTIATAIETGDADLETKLGRAENLEELLSLVRLAEMQEREASLDEALSTFEQAFGLDRLWQPAKKGIGRVQEAIRQRQFQQNMSLAFQAISTKDYELARSLFARAQEVLPDSSEPADGLQQVTQAETNDAISKLRVSAEASMTKNAWLDAISSYEEALAISDSLEFARAGLIQAEWRRDLDSNLEKYLGDPPLLQSDKELKSASALLRDTMRVDKPPTDMQRQIDSLAKLISTARIKIPVTIRSDGKTTVTVRKHANLGTVENQVVYLIPGRYTVTGERTGYRDVREDLVLIAGRPVLEVTVASTERIR